MQLAASAPPFAAPGPQFAAPPDSPCGMHLREPLLRLPLAFDAEALAAEVAALPEGAWQPHPNQLPGNEAVLLATVDGGMTDAFTGQMAPTRWLDRCRHVREAMAAIGAVWGRCRLMRLAPAAVVPPHVDLHFYWRTHLRLHVPIVTSPEVRFTCADETVHMAAGECWIFDTFQPHHVRNPGPAPRTHLVLDTVGGEPLWDLIQQAGAAPRFVPPGSVDAAGLAFEYCPPPALMTPWELRCHIAFIAREALPGQGLDVLLARLDRFAAAWTAAWAEHGGGHPIYRRLIETLRDELPAIAGDTPVLRNRLPARRQVGELLHFMCLPLGGPALAPALRRAGAA